MGVKLCVLPSMDTIEKVKIAWREKFSSEIPDRFISRLECANNLEQNSTQLYDFVKEQTRLKIEELNSLIRKEEYFFEVLSSIRVEGNKMENNPSDPEDRTAVDCSAMYSKVNKPAKSKQSESEMTERNSGDQNVTATQRSSSQSDSLAYEEIEVKNYKGAEGGSITPKNKMRGSVKARIQMFERSDSSSSEEVPSSAEGDYARLVLKPSQPPPVSPKPSPAVRRKPRTDDYEEISLPGSSISSDAKTADNETSSQPNCQTVNTDKCSSDVDKVNCKPESSQADSYSYQPAKLNASSQAKRPAPPVPLRRSRGNECINTDDSDVLKKTEQLTLQYSEHEPQLATNRKQKCMDGVVKPERIRPDDIHVHKRVDRNSEGIEGDYCAITDIKRPRDKHVTLVQVTSLKNKPKSGSLGKSDSKTNKAVLYVKTSDKELSKSHDNLSRIDSGNRRLDSSVSVSRSLEDFKQIDNAMKDDKGTEGDDDNGDTDDDLDYENIDKKPEPPKDSSMRKIFHRKNSGSITRTKHTEEGNQEAVVGTRYKSLSGSESEEDLLSTVQVNMNDMSDNKEKSEDIEANDAASPELSDSDSKTESIGSKSPVMSRMTNHKRRVPDYEKWTFQHLLTKTGISIADTDNLTDTGSEDENIYDNNTPPKHEFREQTTGQSDDSGVLVSETLISPEDGKDEEPSDVIDDFSQDQEKEPMKSTSTSDSRMSTACKFYQFPIIIYHDDVTYIVL